MLKFSSANNKTKKLKTVQDLQKYLPKGKQVYSLDLPAGWSCPFANHCLARVYVVDGKKRIIDSPNIKYRCFSASQEVVYPNVYNLRAHNFALLRTCNQSQMFELINQSLPKNIGICRMHVSGDFFCKEYMFAWHEVALNNPNILFYGYTKSIDYWLNVVKQKKYADNFILTASLDGKQDDLVKKNGLRYAKVVFSELEAQQLGLEIDHNDSHAAIHGASFALLLHGVQPANSVASKALAELKGKGSYGKGVSV
jgi:hypothetical protein